MKANSLTGVDDSSERPRVLDQRALRSCLGQYATGVAVVTAQDAGRRLGMTINSFAALSLTPALVTWSIRNESGARAFFTAVQRFAINVLAIDQVSTSRLFAQGERDPFDQVSWSPGTEGEPLLDGTVASLSCSLVQTVEGGDHTIIIGRIDRFVVAQGWPLIFVQGEYRSSAPIPRPAEAGESERATDQSASSVMRLMSQTTSRLIDEFDVERSKEHLTRAQSRVLAWLGERPHTLDELKLNIEIADADLDEDVMLLKAQGLLRRVGAYTFELTAAGRDKRDSFVARLRSFEAAKLAGLDPGDVEVFKRVLQHLGTH